MPLYPCLLPAASLLRPSPTGGLSAPRLIPAPSASFLLHAPCLLHPSTLKVAPPPLSPAVDTLIREWFSLVDDDGSGELTARELAAALKVRGREEGLLYSRGRRDGVGLSACPGPVHLSRGFPPLP